VERTLRFAMTIFEDKWRDKHLQHIYLLPEDRNITLSYALPTLKTMRFAPGRKQILGDLSKSPNPTSCDGTGSFAWIT
jgi:hypothetical protein